MSSLLCGAGDGELRLPPRGQAVVQVGDEIRTHRQVPGVVPEVAELVRVLVDPVQLTLGAVVGDGAAWATVRQPETSRDLLWEVAEEFLEAVRFADGAGLVRGARPPVAVDRAHVHPVAGELAVSLAQRPLASGAGRRRQRRALHRRRRLHSGDGTER